MTAMLDVTVLRGTSDAVFAAFRAALHVLSSQRVKRAPRAPSLLAVIADARRIAVAH